MSDTPSTGPPRRRRPDRRQEGDREGRAIAVRLGLDLRAARERRAITQGAMGQRIGVGQSRISQMDRGNGAGAPLGLWVAYGIAVGRPLTVGLSRTLDPEPRDAGHLGAQELVLQLSARHRIRAQFELPTRSANPGLSIDVGLRDDRNRVLVIVEIWNRLEDLGAAIRSLHRKVAEADGLAATLGGNDGPYRVAACWILRATAANGNLARRYPAIFRGEFPASSRSWARALGNGEAPPDLPGLVWVDLPATRLYEMRSSGSRTD